MTNINILKIIEVYNIIKSNLPSTYKIPKLAFFEDEESMLLNNELKKSEDESTVYAIINPNTLIISLPLNMSVEAIDKNGNIKYKNILIHELNKKVIA